MNAESKDVVETDNDEENELQNWWNQQNQYYEWMGEQCGYE